VADRVAFVADLARNWARLRAKKPGERRVAIVLANYPNKDGRIGNGVGLDTPASAIAILRALQDAGYRVTDLPADGAALMERLLGGPTNRNPQAAAEERIQLNAYSAVLATLPQSVQAQVAAQWGSAERDPFFHPSRLDCGHFGIPAIRCGNIAVLIQPARGYGRDPKATYHDPALVPPHAYLATYAWLADEFRADAVIDLGKRGTLEWLPGKALALSAECFPEAVLGPLPHLYPFIVNDPGEGTQAKRRAQAVIVDHLTPPLTRAGSYGEPAELERLIDEYYDAARGDLRRLAPLTADILERARAAGIDRDCGIAPDDDRTEALRKLDGFLCELKELQIRDGLHVFGTSPAGGLLDGLLLAIARVRRGTRPRDESLLRALAADLDLGIDPLTADLSEPWTGPKPDALPPPQAGKGRAGGWRNTGDAVERLEVLALRLIAGEANPDPDWNKANAVLGWIDDTLRPAIAACGAAEIAGILAGLDGRFVAPGPSGAPSRGRPEVLPTGRNFFSLDTRAVPTAAAWQLGWHSAGLLVERHAQEHGDYPARVVLSAWGTANMRTGGDDIAQALALIGARPVWEPASGRVTGFEILPASVLDRPRVDVTLRISGFFRDAFPGLIDLFDSAVRAVAALDELPDVNPLAARYTAERAALEAAGASGEDAARRAGYRIFGAKPGAYGAGLQAPIDEGVWVDDGELAEAWLQWGQYAYAAGGEGKPERGLLETRLGAVDAVLHNQDNREHDLLDSDDYYQFEGGLALVVRHLSGRAPAVYHNDHSVPDRPRIRTLREELGRVVRGRAANPRWIEGVMRHGYKGAAEIAATVDYLFAFAATARAVDDSHFEALYDAYLGDAAVRDFIAQANPAALGEIRARFAEAIERGLWRPRRNSIAEALR
jgi:cobaltochelatase CobN